MRRVRIQSVIVLIATFVVVLYVFGYSYLQPSALTEPEIAPGEARLLWIVRDTEPVTFGNMLGAIPRNFGVMLRRAKPDELPTAILLDLWTAMFGHSLASLRATGILVPASGYWIIVAGLYCVFPLLRRLSGRMILIAGLVVSLLTCAVLAFFGPDVYDVYTHCFVIYCPLSEAIENYTILRPLDEPVLTVFGGDSTFGYYHDVQDLRGGITIDLSQRAYSYEELTAVVQKLGKAPVWLLVDISAPQHDATQNVLKRILLTTGRVPTILMADVLSEADSSRSIARYSLSSPGVEAYHCYIPDPYEFGETVNLAREAGMLTMCSMAAGVALVVRRRRAVGCADRQTQERH